MVVFIGVRVRLSFFLLFLIDINVVCSQRFFICLAYNQTLNRRAICFLMSVFIGLFLVVCLITD
jgi:hypothetical protein